jgi:hypothetical protein
VALVFAASNQTIKPFAEALMKDFRSQGTHDSSNHVTRWNTKRQVASEAAGDGDRLLVD